jgi:hypothetical protein
MRNISADALAFLTTQQGIEPLNVVQIDWTPTLTIFYGDRAFPAYSIKGGILELADLDDVVNVTGGNATQSVSLTLDDVDGTIKNIYNNNDIHQRPVTIYQWFDGLPFTDAFILFQGYINSPIVWKEGDRTVSFDIVTKMEDVEAGFSPEIGDFPSIPANLIGRAWPLPFGTCPRVPLVQLDPITSLTALDSNGIPDPSIQKQINALISKIQEMQIFAEDMFKIANFMYKQAAPHNPLVIEDQHYEQLGDQYTAAGNNALIQIAKAFHDVANLSGLLGAQKKYAKQGMRVTGAECIPAGTSLNTSIGGTRHLVTFDGSNAFIVNEVIPPANEGVPQNLQINTVPVQTTVGQGPQETINPLGFGWVPAGNQVYNLTAQPIRYIVAILPVSVPNVWAYQTFNGAKVLMQVPTEYYTVGSIGFGPFVATIVTVNTPLSQLLDSNQKSLNWDDALYADVISPVGPNTVDIITFLINTYAPDLGIDATTFNLVATQCGNSNFCLFKTENIMSLLSAIAYHTRLAIWLKNNVFYLRYLPAQPTPVDTITQDDVITNSLEIHHTPTENIVTKLTASYKTDYSQTSDSYVILRNNIDKYGLFKETDDWFTYLNTSDVDLAATFWLIRKSNTWKLVSFKTPIHKLRLETFDAVTLDFSSNYACNGPIVGIIQSAKFDSQNLQIAFEVWIPVLLGTMTQYNFAWPVDSDSEVFSGQAGIPVNASGTNSLVLYQGTCFDPQPIKIGNRSALTSGAPNPGAKPSGSVVVFNGVGALDTTPKPNFQYQYNQYRVNAPAVIQQQPLTVPGQIVSGNNPNYKANLYFQGLAGQTAPGNVTCIDPNAADLEAGDWIMVVINTWIDSSISTSTPQVQKTFLPSKSSPGLFPGKITDGGPGQDYNADVYFEGLEGEATNVAVKQLDIDDDDTIPEDTWVFVVESKNVETNEVEYLIQVPVWVGTT